MAPSEDKIFLKNNIIQSLISENSSKIQAQLVEAIRYMVREDFPSQWPDMLNSVFAMLASADTKAIKAGIMVASILSYWRVLDDQEDARSAMISSLFNALLPIANELLKGDTEESYLLLKTILKSYQRSIQYTMPKCLREANCMAGWCTVFVRVLLEKSNPAIPCTLDNEKNPFWKMKKWALHCLNHIFAKYGAPDRRDNYGGEYQEFCKFYMTHVFEKVYSSYMQMAQLYSAARTKREPLNMTAKMRHLLYDYLSTW